MKTVRTISSLCFIALVVTCTRAQETAIAKHEIGANLISYGGESWMNTDFFTSPPKTTYLNGIFYRYTNGRRTYRGKLSYIKYKNTSDISCPDCMNGSAVTSRFEISAGSQWALLQRKSFPFVFADVFYQLGKSNGEMQGGIFPHVVRFKSTSSTLGLNVGLGYKITLFKRVCLNPEFGWNYGPTMSKRHETYLSTQKAEELSDNFEVWDIEMGLRATIALSVAF